MKYLIFSLLFTSITLAQQGVGIGTTNPQQKLHIASPTGSLRVESLNGVNNIYNGGDVDGDLDLTNNSFPLYVDDKGDFTLEFKPLYNSAESDALDHTTLPTATATLLSGDTDGKVSTKIITYTVTVNRATILEVKYNISFDTYLNPAKTIITDNYSRRISTYFQVNGLARHYGPAAKCYSSGHVNSVAGSMFNACTAYIFIPAAGTFNVDIYGEVSSGTKGGGGGSTSQATYVEFATGNDSVYMRLH